MFAGSEQSQVRHLELVWRIEVNELVSCERSCTVPMATWDR